MLLHIKSLLFVLTLGFTWLTTWLINTTQVVNTIISESQLAIILIKNNFIEISYVFVGIMTILIFINWLIDKNNSKSQIKNIFISNTKSKIKNFQVSHNELSFNNEVYLTKFKNDGRRVYFLHMLYAIYSYYKNHINLFFLLIAVAQVHIYNDYRSLVPLIAFTIMAIYQHISENWIAIKQQLRINNELIKFQIPLKNKWKSVYGQQRMIKRGNIIELDSKNDVPCDILLLGEQKVFVNELELTGENVEIPKNGLLIENLNFLTIRDITLNIEHHKNKGYVELNNKIYNYDNDNIVFRGTKIIDGTIFGIPVEVGNDCQIFRLDYNINKKDTCTQKLIYNICIKNLCILVFIASIIAVILKDKMDMVFNVKTIIQNLTIIILLLNTMIPLSLQLFYNVSSANISSALSKKHNVKINSHGIRCFQYEPHFIVTDKTGTLTTNEIKLINTYYNGELISDMGKNKSLIFSNLISCSTVGTHSKTGELLKSDQLEVLMINFGKENNCKLISNHVDEFSGHCKYIIDDNTHEITRKYYKSLLYTFGVKVSIIEINEKYFMHVQGMPEKISKYLNNNDAFDTCLNSAENDNITNSNYYKRIISHASKEITQLESSDIISGKMSPTEYLTNFSNWSVYIFHDYIVTDIQKSIEDLKQKKYDITILTGDKQSSALNVGKTIGLINNDYQIITTHDEILTSESILIEGRLVNEMINKNSEQLKYYITNSSNRIIYRADPSCKQKFISFLKSNYEKDVMMVGDGSNDISALIMADVGVGIIGENMTVQYISDILTSTWTKIPGLLEDFKKRKTVINNICYWVVMKHMLTAFTLVGMLIVSSCDQLKDPTSPYLVIFMNTVLFWYMVRYSKIEENNNNMVINTSKWKKQGIFLGIFNGLYVFTTVGYKEGITMAIASTLLQLILKLYSIESKKTLSVKLFYVVSIMIVMIILKYISIVSSDLFFGYLLLSYIFYVSADKIIK